GVGAADIVADEDFAVGERDVRSRFIERQFSCSDVSITGIAVGADSGQLDSARSDFHKMIGIVRLADDPAKCQSGVTVGPHRCKSNAAATCVVTAKFNGTRQNAVRDGTQCAGSKNNIVRLAEYAVQKSRQVAAVAEQLQRLARNGRI